MTETKKVDLAERDGYSDWEFRLVVALASWGLLFSPRRYPVEIESADPSDEHIPKSHHKSGRVFWRHDRVH